MLHLDLPLSIASCLVCVLLRFYPLVVSSLAFLVLLLLKLTELLDAAKFFFLALLAHLAHLLVLFEVRSCHMLQHILGAVEAAVAVVVRNSAVGAGVDGTTRLRLYVPVPGAVPEVCLSHCLHVCRHGCGRSPC